MGPTGPLSPWSPVGPLTPLSPRAGRSSIIGSTSVFLFCLVISGSMVFSDDDVFTSKTECSDEN
jgi:hypothetical protein